MDLKQSKHPKQGYFITMGLLSRPPGLSFRVGLLSDHKRYVPGRRIPPGSCRSRLAETLPHQQFRKLPERFRVRRITPNSTTHHSGKFFYRRPWSSDSRPSLLGGRCEGNPPSHQNEEQSNILWRHITSKRLAIRSSTPIHVGDKKWILETETFGRSRNSLCL